MSEKPKVLLQFDCDQHPSVFDSIVAIDSGVDQLLPFGSVEPIDVRELVHGAMFTRGVDSLQRTAIFIGGSKVRSAEQVLRSVVDTFFGPVRVSVMLDANGANTTAVAAAICLQNHLQLEGKTVAVLAATGSVGRRVAEIVAAQGAQVRVASRSLERAQSMCEKITTKNEQLKLTPIETGGPKDFESLLNGCDAIVSAGAASVRLLRQEQWRDLDHLQVAIDLNAIPPAGIEGIEVTAKGQQVNGTHVYGAIGVGNLKMKIHKKSLQALFEQNDLVLDLNEIFEIGRQLKNS